MATATIPIAFTTAVDPVATGLVASLNRPGGNMTGVMFLGAQLAAKGLGLLRELVPNAKTTAVLVNPDNPNAEVQVEQVQEAARALGLQVLVLKARSEVEFDAVFVSLAQQHADALMVAADPRLISHRNRLVALAARHSVPTAYFSREFVTAGGLLSYGSDIADAYRHVGVYVARILKGARPVDRSVIQPTKFELAIQPQDGQGARPHRAIERHRHCRRGSRTMSHVCSWHTGWTFEPRLKLATSSSCFREGRGLRLIPMLALLLLACGTGGLYPN